MNFTIFIEGFMDIITVHLVFFLSVKVEKIFETCFFFSKLAMRSRGGKVMNYTIKIIIEMLQISWLFIFKEKDKTVKLLTHEAQTTDED